MLIARHSTVLLTSADSGINKGVGGSTRPEWGSTLVVAQTRVALVDTIRGCPHNPSKLPRSLGWLVHPCPQLGVAQCYQPVLIQVLIRGHARGLG